jgi:hypothetical protein
MISVGFITISILYYWLKIAFFPKNRAFLVLQENVCDDLRVKTVVQGWVAQNMIFKNMAILDVPRDAFFARTGDEIKMYL